MGTEAFAERTRRERLATGEKVRRRTVETRDDLTAQEAQIARLASDVRTNPEIGAQLFLSPRTVEWHLRKVFTQLDITSRRELRFTLSARRERQAQRSAADLVVDSRQNASRHASGCASGSPNRVLDRAAGILEMATLRDTDRSRATGSLHGGAGRSELMRGVWIERVAGTLPRHWGCVIEPGVRRIRTPSGSRTNASVTSPLGVACATRRGGPPRSRPASLSRVTSTSTK